MTNKELLQALRLCGKIDSNCRECKLWGDERCVEHLAGAAANVIERLSAERDALIEQIKARPSCLVCKHFDYCEFDNATVIDCMNCVTKKCPCAGCVNSSRWEWRGLPEAPEDGESNA